MGEIHFPVLPLSSVPCAEFVRYWSEQYRYPGTAYADYAGQPVDKKRLLELFKWKNGRSLSKRKQQTVLSRANASNRR